MPDTFGDFAHTPTLSKLRDQGISYNRFHTTSICSPTRAALLTGRNHQRVGSGTIAERAVDWDGYTGVMPMTSATIPEVLRHFGHKTSAFGKWHNTPADQTTAMGPFTYWPTGYGFDYFYGFLAGETSQWEPRLVENTTAIEPPHDAKDYFFDKDMADHCIDWIRMQHATAPGKPFLAYYAPGTAHAPHHAPKDAPASSLTEWTFDAPITRMPESAAPKLGNHAESKWRGCRARPGAGRHVTPLHLERDLRHRNRLGFARVSRLLRSGPVRLQRHHRHDGDQVFEEMRITHDARLFGDETEPSLAA